MNRSDVYRILTNRVFLGEVVHNGNSYPGEHDVIITQAQWDAVRAILKINPCIWVNQSQSTTAPLLRSLLGVPHAAAEVAGAGNGGGNPGWKAAEGGDAAGGFGAVSLGMDTTGRLPVPVTCAAYRRSHGARR